MEKGWRRGGEGSEVEGKEAPLPVALPHTKEEQGKGFVQNVDCSIIVMNYSIKHIQKVSTRKPSNTTLHISSSNHMQLNFRIFRLLAKMTSR